MEVRQAIFAGSWYPSGRQACEKEIEGFIQEARISPPAEKDWIAGIVPHAGWYYSGRIACEVIHALGRNDAVDVVVVIGMHLHPQSPPFVMSKGAWQTPLGEIEIDEVFAEKLMRRFSFQIETPRQFTQDNTIELQLPFIKYFFDRAKLLSVGAPPNSTAIEIGQAIADIANERQCRIKVIGSTDLTHYGMNYGFTSRGTGPEAVDWVKNANDRRIIDAMLAMDAEQVIAEALDHQNACCSGAAAAAISVAKQLGADRAEQVAYATSYDKSPGSSFVGYVGLLFG